MVNYQQTHSLLFFAEPDSIQIANGGHIVYHVDSPQFNTTDVITLRFRTTHENGVLFYGSRDGEFNDVILLELRHGELHFKMELSMYAVFFCLKLQNP
jgi:hypothetical protein